MRLAYFDCFSGISGDMALGALVHAGAELDGISELLKTLPIEGFAIEREDADDHGIWATRIHVKVKPHALIRTYSSVRRMLETAELPNQARRTADRIFHRLALALSKVHGKEPDVVTFHELGEVECLVEVIGCAIALDMLAVDRVFASPVPTGMGMARTEQGMMPVPSAEVVELLQAVPTYTRGLPVELVTPVGAAIVAAVVEGFGDMPLMRADHVGYGAGHPRLDFPNVLRVVVGEEERSGALAARAAGRLSASELFVPGLEEEAEESDVSVARTRLAAVPRLDEPSNVLLEATVAGAPIEGPDADALLDALAGAGAEEAWLTPVVVRGGRPAAVMSAVAPAHAVEDVASRLASTPGAGPVRAFPAHRSIS